MADKSYLSIRQVCEHFGVDYKTIYRQIIAGELRASKIGGVYRIREDDVQEYFERRRAAPREAPAGDVATLIAADRTEVTSPDVARAMAEDRLAEARERLRNGELEVLVTPLQAKQREVSAINRFERKLRELVTLRLPDGRMVRITEPERYITQHDHSDELMNALNVGYLERGMLERLPVNPAMRLTLPDERGRNPLAMIEMFIWSDLTEHARDGFATRRLDLADLLSQLNIVAAEAVKSSAPYILGLASTSGWDAEAQTYIDAEDGSSYTHHLLLPVLIDLTRGVATYDRRDTRIEPYVGLFLPVLRDERIAAAMRAIEDQFVIYDNLAYSELSGVTGASEEITRAAIERLIVGGKYRSIDAGRGEMQLAAVRS